jgi:hypothetical protein
MTSANATELRLFEQTDFDTAPTVADKLEVMRLVSEDLAVNQTTQISNEVRSDGQAADVVRTGLEAAGSLNFELSHATYDKLFEGLLLADAPIGTPTVIDTAVTTISFTAIGQVISTTGTWASNPSAIGEWVKISGANNAANNGYFRIKTISTPATTFEVEGARIVDEAATAAITIQEGAPLDNGTLLHYYGIERENTDLTGGGVFSFAQFQSMVPQTMSLTIPTNGLITGTFGFVGKNEISAVATWGDGSPTAATTTPVFNSVDHLQAIIENDVVMDIVTGAVNVNNNVASRLQAGTLGGISIRKGRFEIGGSITAYLQDRLRIARFLDQSDTNLTLVFEHADGSGYVIDMPRVRLTQGATPTPGINTDVTENLEFGAFMHETLLKTIKISRFD